MAGREIERDLSDFVDLAHADREGIGVGDAVDRRGNGDDKLSGGCAVGNGDCGEGRKRGPLVKPQRAGLSDDVVAA